MGAPEVLGGRYELRGVLGRGGMAEVRDAWDRRLSRAVAIKLLYPLFRNRLENRRRFEVEARAAAALSHFHIVSVHDFGEHHGIPFIVMERLTGYSLADRIAEGPLPEPLVHNILDQVLAALAAAHDAGVLHRDIKPSNILFTASGDAKVADFGIAKTVDGGNTATGQVLGTMGYLSPQRILGQPATVADDLYAVGVVGYETLAGRRPFPQRDLAALAYAILHEQPPPILALRPELETGLAAIIEHASARDRALQFHSAAAMRAALAGHQAATVPARPPTRVLDTPLPPSPAASGRLAQASRRPKLLAAAAVLAAALPAVILLAVSSTTQTTPPTPADTSTTAPTPPAVSSEPPTTPVNSEPAPPPGPPPPGPHPPGPHPPGPHPPGPPPGPGPGSGGPAPPGPPHPPLAGPNPPGAVANKSSPNGTAGI